MEIPGFLSSPSHTYSIFNGATSFQTWKLRSSLRNLPCFDVLQWGHVFSDVEILSSAPTNRTSSCFNGATSFQTWKCRLYFLMIFIRACFNGATSFQTWKYPGRSSIGPTSAMLQWGHVFSDVEISFLSPKGIQSSLSSMGPRLFRRGNARRPQGRPCSSLFFNGATSFQTWK